MTNQCEKGGNQIHIVDSDVIIKRYRIRAIGNSKSTIETTIPREVFEREARRLGLTFEEALEETVAVWRYNGFRARVSESISEEQQANPQRISNISNMVTIGDIIDVQMTVLMDSYEKICGVCGRLSMTRRNAEIKNRPSIPICETCAQEFLRVKARTGA